MTIITRFYCRYRTIILTKDVFGAIQTKEQLFQLQWLTLISLEIIAVRLPLSKKNNKSTLFIHGLCHETN